eukprot:6176703-Pleurochrysis_carterae.AAC.2
MLPQPRFGVHAPQAHSGYAHAPAVGVLVLPTLAPRLTMGTLPFALVRPPMPMVMLAQSRWRCRL